MYMYIRVYMNQITVRSFPCSQVILVIRVVFPGKAIRRKGKRCKTLEGMYFRLTYPELSLCRIFWVLEQKEGMSSFNPTVFHSQQQQKRQSLSQIGQFSRDICSPTTNIMAGSLFNCRIQDSTVLNNSTIITIGSDWDVNGDQIPNSILGRAHNRMIIKNGDNNNSSRNVFSSVLALTAWLFISYTITSKLFGPPQKNEVHFLIMMTILLSGMMTVKLFMQPESKEIVRLVVHQRQPNTDDRRGGSSSRYSGGYLALDSDE